MTKKKTLEVLADYFIEVGKVLTKKEYMAKPDAPIRAILVGRAIGSWARLPEMIARNFPDKFKQINNSNYAIAQRAADKSHTAVKELKVESEAVEAELKLMKESLVKDEKALTELKVGIGKKSAEAKELTDKLVEARKIAADMQKAADKLAEQEVEPEGGEDEEE